MVNIIKAEHQKAKRTMRKKFIWGFPLLTFVMAFIFTLGMTNAYAAGDDCSILLSFCGAGEKDKILSFNDYSHRQKKIVAGENYLYWVHDFAF